MGMLVARQFVPRRFAFHRFRGLGFSYNDLLNQAGLQNCDPRDVQCVSDNQQRQIAVEDLWTTQYMTNPNTANLPTPAVTITPVDTPAAIASFLANQPVTSTTVSVGGGPAVTTQQLQTLPVFTSSPNEGIYRPKVTFQNSRGGSVLYPGDTWTISISGGIPQSPVVVVGGVNGANNSTQMGVTDYAGNWSKSGTIDASQVGAWSERWSVGDNSAGNISFTVASSPSAPAVSNAPATPAAQGAPSVAATPGVRTTTGAGTSSVQCFRLFGGFEDCVGPIGSLTGLVALAVIGLFFLGGRKK